MNPNRLPLVMFALLGLVLVVCIGAFTASWVWFAIALAVHLIASAVVISGSMRAAQAGERSNRESQKLDRMADSAVGSRPRNVETELEALKREPSQRV